jgi:ribose 5-phosphate isomerase A
MDAIQETTRTGENNGRQEMKNAVGKAAAAMVQPGMVVGLGSGSTAAVVVDEIGRCWQEGELRDIVGVSTSFQSSLLATKHGIPMATLNDVDHIDLAIDGADEVDPAKNLIKGGGGCQTREKLVDSRADRLVIVVDSGKLVAELGSTMPLPVEVLPEAYRQVMEALAGLGGRAELRMALRKAGPVVSDQGNLIVDAMFADLADPASLERTINNIPGVLENGLFVNIADEILVGRIGDGDSVSVERIP